MVGRFYLFLLLLLPTVPSDTGHRINMGQSDYIAVEDILQRHTHSPSSEIAKAAVSDAMVNKILSDHENKIPAEFKIPPYFYYYVRFWFGVYTRYSSENMIIHDRDDLSIVYTVLDFTKVRGEGLNRFAKSTIQSEITMEKLTEIKRALLDLADGKDKTGLAANLLSVIKKSQTPIPDGRAARRKFFVERADNVRTQTGQRNMIYNGLINEMPYDRFLESLFLSFKLPHELKAIPFLESSFNNTAHSKVGAAGIWQFMPLISSYFVPRRTPLIDYRLSPVISSVAALHLLKENKLILRSWDLAVTAYNSGTKHLVTARKFLKKDVVTLEEVFLKYQSPSIGFASKNFYAEFLALVHTLAYRNSIFPLEGVITSDTIFLEDSIMLYVSKCSFIPEKLYQELSKTSPHLDQLNPHLRHEKKSHPRSTIVVSDILLPPKRFYRVSTDDIVKWRPIHWNKLIKNQSCSTR